VSESNHAKKETPHGRAYRRASEKYHNYTQQWRTAIQTISHHCSTRRQQYGGWEQEKKIIEVAAVVLIFVYTAIQGCQLWVIRDQEKRQLRAYIGIIIPKPFLQSTPLPPAIPTVKFDVRNYGQTPAYSVLQWAGVGIKNYPISKGVEFSILPQTIPHPVTIFPGTFDNVGITIPAERELTSDEMNSIGDGSAKRLYFWGTIRYVDIFGDRHYTNYCVGVFALTTGAVKYDPCNVHNEAD
jgi:hypothetical protein